MHARSMLLDVVTGITINSSLRIVEMHVKIIRIVRSGGLVTQRIDVRNVVAQNLQALGKAFKR